MVAGNLSRNTNVVKKESIVSKRPKDQEEIIWANERSKQSAPAIPKYEYGLCRSEERRVGKECLFRVDLGGRRIIKKNFFQAEDGIRDSDP